MKSISHILGGTAAVLIASLLHPAAGGATPKEDANASRAESIEAAESLYQQGLQLLQGHGVKQDEKAAFDHFSRAAAMGHGDAIGSVGYFYSTGKVVARDDSRARELFEQAAAKGASAASVNLGRFLIEGRGGPKDVTRGVEIIQKAAATGSPTARQALGDLYFWGELPDGKPDYARALTVMKGLADEGNADAQNMVGVIIRDRLVEGLDRASSRAWFEKAAAQRHKKACNNLGQLLHQSPDAETRLEGLKWLLVAAYLNEITATRYLSGIEPNVPAADMRAAKERATQLILSWKKP